MTSRRLEEAAFDAVVAQAFADAQKTELAALPQEEVLARKQAFSPAFEKKIKLLQRRRNARRGKGFRLCRALAAALIIIVICASLLLPSATVRAAIKQTVMEFFKEYVSLEFQTAGEAAALGDIVFAYIPRGYSMDDQERLNDVFLHASFVRAGGPDIYFTSYPAEGTSMNVDNERSTMREISVNGNEGYLFTFDEGDAQSHLLIWIVDGRVYDLMSAISAKELIRMAEKMEIYPRRN